MVTQAVLEFSAEVLLISERSLQVSFVLLSKAFTKFDSPLHPMVNKGQFLVANRSSSHRKVEVTVKTEYV